MASVSAGCALGLAMTGRPEWTEWELTPRLSPCEGGDLPLIYRPSIAPHIGGLQIDFVCGPQGDYEAPGRAAPRSVESDVAWQTGQSFKSIGHVRCRGDMNLRLFNTRTRRKDPFVPRTPGDVKMYVCGPTTYDYSHLGHARSYIAFDTARRYLESLGLRVAYAQIFTDIESVIILTAGKKEDPLDFALWKRSKEGEPSWPSAWGPGRPGWHVECNAMAFKYLGAPLDIHGGGLDLVFPHHESEAMICQGAWGVDWSRTWMHNGFLTLEREKMSKSLGNFVTIREVLRDYPGEVVRFCLLKSHYRENVEYDETLLGRAKGEWGAMRAAIASAKAAGGAGTDGTVAALLARTQSAFRDAMDDDLNTQDAVRSLQRMTEGLAAFGGVSAGDGRAVVNVYRECGRVLGLFADLG